MYRENGQVVRQCCLGRDDPGRVVFGQRCPGYHILAFGYFFTFSVYHFDFNVKCFDWPFFSR